MRVVSNTSPISYLVAIEHIDLLPRLFQRIIIPEAVRDELLSPKAPPIVQHWIKSPPSWLELQPNPIQTDSSLQKLDIGERVAILLAEQIKADLILLDDLAARRIAESRGLNLTGTLGVLDRAASQGWIDLAAAIASLQQTNFRTSKAIIQSLLEKHT